MMRVLWMLVFVLSLFLAAGSVLAGEVPVETDFPAILPGPPAHTLRIVSSTDLVNLSPLIGLFQLSAPDTAVHYVEYQSSWEMYLRLAAACTRGESVADLTLSSAVDLQVKLVNDGCSLPHDSAATRALPDWARWRGEVFGLTFEPAVIVYAKRDFPDGDPPRSRFALIDLLRRRPADFQGRVATYDIDEAGVGYLFNAMDYQQAGTYGRLFESLARADVKLVCCTSRILDGLEDGSLALGYNALGSYAVARLERGANIGIILPSDYTLVLSRAAFIAKHSPVPEVAGRFIDFALSPAARGALNDTTRLLSIVDGEEILRTLPVEGFSGRGQLRPIELAPRLLAGQDAVRRRGFLRDWARTLKGGGR